MKKVLRRIKAWDRRMIFLVISKRRSGLTRFFVLMTRLGDGWFYFLIAFLQILFLPFQLSWLIFGGIAFSIELALYKLIKPLSKRRRPFHRYPGIKNLVIPPDLYSFPSGHTAAATVAVFVFSINAPVLLPILILFAILVGLSRVYLGVHYPTDVIVGALLALLSLFLATKLTELILSILFN
ncbi:MAG: phosphatase PAP2 family protein [Bacteroidetes bacterium]|nr:phosphatase PAP2 family protein [Bacteroidota bacterium]